jgi:hypothetical protein
MIETDGGVLQNLAARQYHSKQGGLQESGVDERRIIGCIAQMERFGNQYELPQYQRIDERDTTG